MSIFSKLGKWTKKNIGTISKIALPLVGFAAGMVVPGLGGAIGKIAGKIGGKISAVTGVGDSKPGILGIGDGLPGILGIGTGKGLLKSVTGLAKDKLAQLKDKVAKGEPLAPSEELALVQAESDMKKEGINPLIMLGGVLLGLFAFRK